MRVVSLLPSATEIVHDLGAGAALVGRSEECDYPAAVRALPVVMRARAWDADRPSAEIDDRVRRVRGSGESLYELDLDRLRDLAPDVLLTQDLCGVCSVTDAEVESACRATGIAPRIVTLSPRTLEEVWDSVETVGKAIDRPSEGRELAESLRARSAPPEPAGPAPPSRIAVVEWLDPPILAGLWSLDIVRAAGGESIGVQPSVPGLRTTWPDLAAAEPDLVVLSPCSFSVARSRAELEDPALRREVARLRPSHGVWLADEAHFSRPGPRLADGVELLRALRSGRDPPGPMAAERWEPENRS